MENIHLALFFNLLLFAMLLGLQVIYRIRSHGIIYSLSSLDNQKPEKTCQLRARRAKDNQIEFLVLLTSLIVLMDYSEQSMEYHALAIGLLIFSRVAYVISVLFGIAYLRSFTWSIGFMSLGYLAFNMTLNT